jgi:hypothetical protein
VKRGEELKPHGVLIIEMGMPSPGKASQVGAARSAEESGVVAMAQ